MQTSFLTGIIISLLLIAFKEKTTVSNQGQGVPVEHVSNLDTSRWWLSRVHQDTATIDVINKKAFIRFKEEKGSAGGNGSCNSFGSTMKRDGNNVSFTNIFSTKMYCEGVQPIENSFLDLLGKVTRYEISGTNLWLFAGDKKVLEFVRNKL